MSVVYTVLYSILFYSIMLYYIILYYIILYYIILYYIILYYIILYYIILYYIILYYIILYYIYIMLYYITIFSNFFTCSTLVNFSTKYELGSCYQHYNNILFLLHNHIYATVLIQNTTVKHIYFKQLNMICVDTVTIH